MCNNFFFSETRASELCINLNLLEIHHARNIGWGLTISSQSSMCHLGLFEKL